MTHTSLIDNIYVKVTNNNSKLNFAILVSDISDHFPIFGMVSTNCNHSSKGKSLVLEKRKFTIKSINLIQTSIENTNWNYLLI